MLPRLRAEENHIISKTSKALANIIPALTTELWKCHEEKRNDIAEDAELDEFLGMGKIDDANKQLAQAMEADKGEAMDGYIEKRISRSFKKHLAKERTTTRKFFGCPQKPGGDAHRQWCTKDKQIQKATRQAKKEIKKEISGQRQRLQRVQDGGIPTNPKPPLGREGGQPTSEQERSHPQPKINSKEKRSAMEPRRLPKRARKRPRPRRESTRKRARRSRRIVQRRKRRRRVKEIDWLGRL